MCSFKRIGVLIVILAASLFSTAIAAVAKPQDPCLKLEHATQLDLNECEFNEYKKADAELNQTYQKLLAKYKANPEFLAKLKLAQRAWINYRDADLEANYYQKDKLGAYGSVYPMCMSIFKMGLTQDRTQEMNLMLTYQEGNVCGFSAPEESSRNVHPQNHPSCRSGSSNPGVR